MQDYGAALRKLRKHFNYTQIALARKLNVSYQAVSKWENNANRMDLDIIRAVCDVFGITPDEFIRIADGADVTEIINGKDMRSEASQAPQYGVQGGESAMPCEPSAGTDSDRDGKAPRPQEATEQSERTDSLPVSNAPKADLRSKKLIVIISAVAAALLTFVIVMCAVFIPKRRSGGFSSIISNITPSERTVTITLYDGQNNEFWSYTCNIGDTIIEPITYKDGYEFKGWYTDIAFKHEASFPSVAQSDVTLYGKWVPEQKVSYITLNFLPGKGVGVPRSERINKNESYVLSRSDYEYNYDGVLCWRAPDPKDMASGDVYYAIGEKIDFSAYKADSIDLVACYEFYATIWFDSDGGILKGPEQVLARYTTTALGREPGFSVSAGDCGKNGYILDHWEINGKPVTDWFEPGAVIDGYYTAKAIWKEGAYDAYIVQYICAFDGCGIHSSTVKEGFDYGEKYVLHNPYEHEGYECAYIEYLNTQYKSGDELDRFDFAHIDAEVHFELITCDTVIEVETDEGVVTYIDYAWTYGNDLLQAVQRLETEGALKPKTGYHISAIEVYINDELYEGSTYWAITSDGTAFLKVKATLAPNEATVKFNGGGEIADIVVPFDTESELPPAEPKQGYIFVGWRIDEVLYAPYEKYKNTAADDVTKGAYAEWDAIKYTVEFSYESGDLPQAISAEYDARFTMPSADLSSADGESIGWSDGENRYYFGQSAVNLTSVAGAKVVLRPIFGKLNGGGVEHDPYVISTYDELNSLALFIMKNDNKKAYYKLGCDIDCDGKPLYPIIRFDGVFDGNFHTISNAVIKGSGDYVGLFGVVGGTVSKLGLTNYSINEKDGSYFAPLVAVLSENGRVSRSFASGTLVCEVTNEMTEHIVTKYINVGGLIGYMDGGTVEDCYSAGNITVSARNYVVADAGGLVGGVADPKKNIKITRCYADIQATLTARWYGYYAAFVNNHLRKTIGYTRGELDLINSFVSGRVKIGGQNVYAYAFISNRDYAPASGSSNYRDENYGADIPFNDKLRLTEAATAVPASTLKSATFLAGTLGWNMTDVWQTDGVSLPTLKGFSA